PPSSRRPRSSPRSATRRVARSPASPSGPTTSSASDPGRRFRHHAPLTLLLGEGRSSFAMKVETEGLLSIGRFARWSGLTVKALRHYDEIGLLRPAHVDDWTGYRWYEPSQVRDAVAIRRLRALRVPLERIAVLVHADEATLREALEVHRAQLEGELVETRQILTELDRLIEGKEKLVTELVLDLTLVDEPAGRYAVFGDRVRVDDLFTFIPETCMRV